MFRKIAIAAAIAVPTLFGSSAMATTCPAYTYTLTNGTTADATQVMTDFNDIRTCANTSLAPLAGPHFTGNVGIGTTSPVYSLVISNGGAEGLEIAPGSGGGIDTLQFYNRSGSSYDAARFIAGYYRFDTGGTERMRIDTSGKVGIGTATPATALDVAGTIRQSNCTTAGTLSANTSGDIVCTSDARLKNILGDYTAGLDVLAHLTPKLFTYKTTASNPVETFVHAGFIAQNVMAVIPQASALQRDGYYSLDTTAVLAATVNAANQLRSLADKQADQIRRQQAQIDQANRNIAALLAVSRKQAAAITALQARFAGAGRRWQSAAR